ncbi:MAG: aminodeoxychorismate synthase component I [Armatimonadota bacterium]
MEPKDRKMLSLGDRFWRDPGFCLLSRMPPAAPGGSWWFCGHSPALILEAKDGRAWIRRRTGRVDEVGPDPLAWLAEYLRARPDRVAVGYWGYDLRYLVERLPRLAVDDLSLPDCRLAIYKVPWSLAEYDRVTPGTAPAVPPPPGVSPGGEVESSFSRTEYEAAVRKILDYIAAGDCYQVNLSQRFSAPYPGSPWELYLRLRETSPAPFSAFLNCGDHQVLSASPELFLRVRGREVETHPIKGTRPRGATPEEDAANAAELLSSVKDRAELLMIVDLERNDLGRVCEYGSVHVPDLWRLESYSNVHHLVATVRGTLRPELGPLDCLRAAFPGGSITGAPKIRAMEIIEELEPVRRGVYTGAIGWVDGWGNAEWSIAIRTMVVKDGRAYFSAGGGIIADSDPAAEYAETLAKAQGMLRALGMNHSQGGRSVGE